MKKLIFALTALTIYSSTSLAATNVSCTLMSLNGDDTTVIASANLDCKDKDVQTVTTEIGKVEFSCANAGDITTIAVKNLSSSETLSDDRALSNTNDGSFSSYYLTEARALVSSCRN